jgi:hypothetical protein
MKQNEFKLAGTRTVYTIRLSPTAAAQLETLKQSQPAATRTAIVTYAARYGLETFMRTQTTRTPESIK